MIWLVSINLFVLVLAALMMLRSWHYTLDIPGFLRWIGVRFAWLPDALHAKAPPSLREYIGPAVSFLGRTFMLAWLFWILFYIILLVEGRSPQVEKHDSFLPNLMSNMTTYFLVLFYFKLSAPRDRNIANWEFRRVLLAGWLFVLLAVTSFEYLTVFRDHVVLHNTHATARTFKVIYGMAQGLVLFLIVGRLESATIRDHIEVNGGYLLLLLYKVLLLVGYAYAAIQPLYPAFEDRPEWTLQLLVTAALLGKLGLLLLLHLSCMPLPVAQEVRTPRDLLKFLFRKQSDLRGLSSLEHHLYEMERFGVEELSWFEHQFRRKHFGHLERLRLRSHQHVQTASHSQLSNSAGIEYAYLNDFKRAHLGLSHLTEGGVWVKRVYAGSGASASGMKLGDYVTHIDDVPLGRNNRLTKLLEGYGQKDKVRVSWLSLQATSIQRTTTPQYAYLHAKVDGPGPETVSNNIITPQKGGGLGMRFKYNSPKHGVVCTWPDSSTHFTICGLVHNGQYYSTPDVHMLRTVLAEIPTSDPVQLHGQDLIDMAGNKVTDLEIELKPVFDHARIGSIVAFVCLQLKEQDPWTEGTDPIPFLPLQWRQNCPRDDSGWPFFCIELLIWNGRICLSAVVRERVPDLKLHEDLYAIAKRDLPTRYAGRKRTPRQFTLHQHPEIPIAFDGKPTEVAQAIIRAIEQALKEPSFTAVIDEVAALLPPFSTV